MTNDSLSNCKIYFIDGDRRIPFSEFLRDRKDELDCSWKELEELCGVKRINTYGNNTSQGNPNTPPQDKFLRIIEGLGYKPNQFEQVSETPNRNPPPEKNTFCYEMKLVEIGLKILELNLRPDKRREQLLSSSLIKKVTSGSFYHKHGYTIEDRIRMHEELTTLDSMFEDIGLQHQIQNRGIIRPLEPFEEDKICDLLLSYITTEDITYNPDRIPQGTYEYIQKHINMILEKTDFPQRSIKSVEHHVMTIWRNYKKMITLTEGSPDPNLLPEEEEEEEKYVPVLTISSKSDSNYRDMRHNINRCIPRKSASEKISPAIVYLGGEKPVILVNNKDMQIGYEVSGHKQTIKKWINQGRLKPIYQKITIE
jgi:hypothetical protein